MFRAVSTADLAEELNVTTETVARWIRQGRFPNAFRRRGRWRIPADEAEEYALTYGGEDDEAD